MSKVMWERRECVSAEVEDSLVLLDLDTLLYHSLNSTAAYIWESLSEPHDEEFLVQRLCSRFEVAPETCRVSVERMLSELASQNLVKQLAA